MTVPCTPCVKGKRKCNDTRPGDVCKSCKEKNEGRCNANGRIPGYQDKDAKLLLIATTRAWPLLAAADTTLPVPVDPRDRARKWVSKGKDATCSETLKIARNNGWIKGRTPQEVLANEEWKENLPDGRWKQVPQLTLLKSSSSLATPTILSQQASSSSRSQSGPSPLQVPPSQQETASASSGTQPRSSGRLKRPLEDEDEGQGSGRRRVESNSFSQAGLAPPAAGDNAPLSRPPLAPPYSHLRRNEGDLRTHAVLPAKPGWNKLNSA